MKICHVVSAGELSPADLPQRKAGDLIIAADAGLLALREAGLDADLFIGDGDSLGFLPQDLPVTPLPPVKDDTDTLAALKLGLARGYRSFRLYGALGGRRPSHALANLQSLLFLQQEGAHGVIVDSRCTMELLPLGETRFAQETGFFSLFALGGEAHVFVTGAKYEGDLHLTPAFPLGVSNEGRGETCVALLEGSVLLVKEP